MTQITELTDIDALKVAELMGGASHLSDDSRIHQVKEILCTNKLYSMQTNVPPIAWYRVFKYLELKDYQIEAK